MRTKTDTKTGLRTIQLDKSERSALLRAKTICDDIALLFEHGSGGNKFAGDAADNLGAVIERYAPEPETVAAK